MLFRSPSTLAPDPIPRHLETTGLDENSTKSFLLLEIEMEAPESHKTLKAEHKAAKADGNAKTLLSEGLVDKAS